MQRLRFRAPSGGGEPPLLHSGRQGPVERIGVRARSGPAGQQILMRQRRWAARQQRLGDREQRRVRGRRFRGQHIIGPRRVQLGIEPAQHVGVAAHAGEDAPARQCATAGGAARHFDLQHHVRERRQRPVDRAALVDEQDAERDPRQVVEGSERILQWPAVTLGQRQEADSGVDHQEVEGALRLLNQTLVVQLVEEAPPIGAAGSPPEPAAEGDAGAEVEWRLTQRPEAIALLARVLVNRLQAVPMRVRNCPDVTPRRRLK